MSEVGKDPALDYFKGDQMAADVWRGKYQFNDEQTPDNMHWRMAEEISRIEDKYQEKELKNQNNIIWNSLSHYGRHRNMMDPDDIYQLFKDFKYIVPQGSIMSMLGTGKFGSLSNCFVIGQPYDSYGGIFQKDQEMAQLEKRRGGVGLDISTLRPKGVVTNNAANTSTGAASFMERFSNTTREVAQDGRRGALMLTIDVRHPDVFEFVNIKKDRTKVTGANISVMLRDDFMEVVKNNEDYILRWPCNEKIEFEDINSLDYNKLILATSIDGNDVYIKRIKAKELYDQIVENAWDNAEPGQMFVDRHWNYSPDGVYPQYRGVTTNPCGEIFMQPYDACRLLALNLFSFVVNPFTSLAHIDYNKLYQMAYEQQRIADDIVDLELEHIDRIIQKIQDDPEPLEVKQVELDLWTKIRNVAKSGRRTGCGFTGLADMLAALGFKYDSEESKEVIDLVLRTKMNAELDCTIDLAILRGTFDGWDWQKEFSVTKGNNSFYQMLQDNFIEQAGRMCDYGRRNISWSTVAPTGTVSMMTQTSSGLEPIFLPFYMRRKKVNPNDKNVRVDFTDQNGDTWQEYPVLHPKFKDWINIKIKEGGKISVATSMSKVKKVDIDINNKQHLELMFVESPWYKSTANDIDWKERIDIQAIIQKYTTHSISSTLNLPSNITKDEVSKIYMEAYDKGLKGVTIYRDGCRTGVLVAESTKESIFEYRDAPKRPKELQGEAHSVSVKGEKFNVIVGLLEGKPYEVFAFPYSDIKGEGKIIKQKRGEYDFYQNSTINKTRVLTDIMSDEQAALTRLISTSLRHGADITFIVEQLSKSNGDITSYTKAIARVLKKYVSEDKLVSRNKCQDCGSTDLRMEEGCQKCNSCGSSKCG